MYTFINSRILNYSFNVKDYREYCLENASFSPIRSEFNRSKNSNIPKRKVESAKIVNSAAAQRIKLAGKISRTGNSAKEVELSNFAASSTSKINRVSSQKSVIEIPMEQVESQEFVNCGILQEKKLAKKPHLPPNNNGRTTSGVQMTEKTPTNLIANDTFTPPTLPARNNSFIQAVVRN